MTKLYSQIELIERIDHLIRLKATGTPGELSQKLNVSESSVYRIIEAIKEMGAPVKYSIAYQSYIYSEEVSFFCGFYTQKLSPVEYTKTNGGFKNLQFFLKEFCHCQNLRVNNSTLVAEFSAQLK